MRANMGWRHVPALDGLRGVAVAAVLLFHGGHLTGGYLGVDLFFVLSGFLITSLLLEEHRSTGRISLRAFWARRARRLLPALLGLLIGVAFYAAVFASSSELARIRGDSIATLGYVANWHDIFANRGYFNLFAVPSPLEHVWSLAIEEQFYLLWPLIVLGVLRWRRGSHQAILVTALTGAGLSALEMMLLYRPDGDPSRLYFGTDTRAAAILLGAALAAFVSTEGHVAGRRARGLLEATGIAAMAGLAWAWTTLDGLDARLYGGGLLACGIGATVLIAAATHPVPGAVSRIFSFGPLRWLGTISYGVYLWHWPIYIVLTESRTQLHGWPLLLARVGMTIAVATASAYLLEQPIRNGALAPKLTRTLTPAAVALTLLAVVATTLGAKTTSAVANAPRTDARGATLMFVGDSVANSLGELALGQGSEAGYVPVNRSVVSCSLVQGEGPIRDFHGQLGTQSKDCASDWDADIARFKPAAVVLVLGGLGVSEIRLGGRWTGPCDASWDTAFEQRLRAAVQQLSAGGAHVAFATSPRPAADFLPDVIAKRDACANDVYRKVAAEDSRTNVIDLDAFVCPSDSCRHEINGEPLRPDGLHFAGPGGLEVIRWLSTELQAVLHEG